MFSSEDNSWETPPELFKIYDDQYHFTLDVCATPENTKCEKYFTIEDDGLKQNWSNDICWMNPPYSEPEQLCKPNCKKKRCEKRGYHLDKYEPGQVDWVKKAYEESCKGTVVICLLPARPDTKMFHKYIWDSKNKKPKEGVIVDFIKGRIKFVGAESSAPFPSMVVIFDICNKL
jgi:site-specific DNA-methyltransferase (adenine-specific)